MVPWSAVRRMCCWRVVLVCVLISWTACWGSAEKRTIRITDCNEHGWLDIREDKQDTPLIKCGGFDGHQAAMWRIIANNTVVANATCEPFPPRPFLNCSVKTSNITYLAVVRRSNTSSYLFIIHNRRGLAGNATIECYLQGNIVTSTCRTNVVYPAVLSDLEVTVATNQTLAGNCTFSKAYSSNGTYTCTWTLTPLDRQGGPDVIIPGDITKTEQTSNGKLYYRGTCSFTRQIPVGEYNYTVRFFPGEPGPQYQGSVNVSDSTPDPASAPTPDPTPDPAVTTDDPTGVHLGLLIAAAVVLAIIDVIVIIKWKKATGTGTC